MADILYKTTILTDTTNTIGVNTSLELSNKNDFETNYKSQGTSISLLELSGQTSIIEVAYSTFKTFVVTPYTWTNVKYITKSDRYELYLFNPSVTDNTDSLIVDSNIIGGNVTISSIVNDANKFFSDVYTITSRNEATIRTYTVPTGKTFRLIAWQINADHPLAIDIILYINNVAKIKFYLDPSSGRDSNYLYTAPVTIAQAGDIIKINCDPTMPRGEVNSILVGIES